jgi:hypothetical protein
MSRLRELLNDNILEVKFTKLDGTERLMTCTLNMDKIPKDMQPKVQPIGAEPKPIKEDVIAVYDLNAEGWRSFTVANIINFSVTGG